MPASSFHFQFGLKAILVLTTLIAIVLAIARTGPVPATISLTASLTLALIFLLGVASLTRQTAGESVAVLFLTAVIGASTGAGLTKLFFTTTASEPGFFIPLFIIIGALVGSFVSVLYVCTRWRSKSIVGRRLRLPTLIRTMMVSYGWVPQWECSQCDKLFDHKFDVCPYCDEITSARETQRLRDYRTANSVLLAVVASVLVVIVLFRGPSSGLERVFSIGFVVASCLAALLGFYISIQQVRDRTTSSSGGGIPLVWHSIVVVAWVIGGITIYLNW